MMNLASVIFAFLVLTSPIWGFLILFFILDEPIFGLIITGFVLGVGLLFWESALEEQEEECKKFCLTQNYDFYVENPGFSGQCYCNTSEGLIGKNVILSKNPD
jgi:hypothetical protein